MKVIIIAAVTLDGKISHAADEDVQWTSAADKKFFSQETKAAGVVIFGSTTYQAMGRALPGRLNIVMTRHPEKFSDQTRSGILEFTDLAPAAILDNLAERGYNTVIIGGGSAVYSLFLAANLVDEIYLNVVAKIFGRGVSLFHELDINPIDLELLAFDPLGEGEVLLKYRVMSKAL